MICTELIIPVVCKDNGVAVFTKFFQIQGNAAIRNHQAGAGKPAVVELRKRVVIACHAVHDIAACHGRVALIRGIIVIVCAQNVAELMDKGIRIHYGRIVIHNVFLVVVGFVQELIGSPQIIVCGYTVVFIVVAVVVGVEVPVAVCPVEIGVAVNF